MKTTPILAAVLLSLALVADVAAGDRNLSSKRYNNANAANVQEGYPIWPANGLTLADAITNDDFGYTTTTIAANATVVSRVIRLQGTTGNISLWFDLFEDYSGDAAPNVALGVLTSPNSTAFGSSGSLMVKPETGGDVATVTNENLAVFQISVPVADFMELSITNNDTTTVTIVTSEVVTQ